MAKFMVMTNIMNICAMTDTNQDNQRLNPHAEIEKQKREARLAEALRANLRRRKAQKRGRDSGQSGDADQDKDNTDG